MVVLLVVAVLVVFSVVLVVLLVAGADMCSVGYKSVLPNKDRQMTYTHQGNCRSSVCRSKGGRPQVV